MGAFFEIKLSYNPALNVDSVTEKKQVLQYLILLIYIIQCDDLLLPDGKQNPVVSCGTFISSL